MTQSDYFDRFDKILQELSTLTQGKNKDYAEASDAFANFKQIEYLTDGRVSLENGILVRMTDKLKRIASLIQPEREVMVRGEKVIDTLNDLAVYSIILRIYLEQKENGPTKTPSSL